MADNMYAWHFFEETFAIQLGLKDKEQGKKSKNQFLEEVTQNCPLKHFSYRFAV